MHNKRRRGKRPGNNNKIPATHNERRRGQQPGHHDRAPARRRGTTSGAAGIGLGTTANYLRAAESIGLGTTAKYLQRTTSAAEEKGR
jgi:hypothetical protein